MDYITIKGARQHNLKNIDLKIPKNQLVILTGLSGSGKSSLAFDTIYAEGQRRYVESLSSYARQFLGIMNKPDVDSIEGLSPAISIDQKTTSHNPRSTVGTITEIYDYFRLLFARVGHPHCPNCGREISRQSIDQITGSILDLIRDHLNINPHIKFAVLSPVVRDKKGEFTGLLENLRKKGFTQARIDSLFSNLDEEIILIKTNKHSISAVVDRVVVDKKTFNDEVSFSQLRKRLVEALEQSTDLSAGLTIVSVVHDKGFDFPKNPNDYTDHLFSEEFACPECNISLPEIEPRIFSFNSPHGACPDCNGLGSLLKVDANKVVAPDISLSEGAIIPFARTFTHDSWYSRLVKTVTDAYNESVKTPFKLLPKNLQKILLYGDDPSRVYTVYGTNRYGRSTSYDTTFEGFIPNLERRYQETKSEFMRNEISKFMTQSPCPLCQGKRLKTESLSVTIDQKNIYQVCQLPIDDTLNWTKNLPKKLSTKEKQIAELIINELVSRLKFLNSVGLSYLNLNREAGTLAGGEAQRIRLASQIGTGLTGVLYILDEPTIGLHPRDNQQLLDTLKNLRDLGNSVIVVEHDADTMLASDHIIDIGPGAGKHGGVVVAQGTPSEILKLNTLTAKYLSGKRQVTVTKTSSSTSTSKPTNSKHKSLTLTGCSLHNLKNIDVTFPLGKFSCITGVSGSGKSTLMHDTLYTAIKNQLDPYSRLPSKHYQSLNGYEPITKVRLIDQSPIGKTPRSNPATYTKVFDQIRKVFSNTKEAKLRGYKPGRFSFNVKGGRCESCQGEGQVKIEMQFLPDIFVTCEVCQGRRYNLETLEVLYKGKTISDVLKTNIEDAAEFFHTNSNISQKLKVLCDVGLGYLDLGQPAPTLSGGEAQRVKLARELSVNSLGHTVYLLDEPTTGLHFEDIRKLLNVLYRLVANNNTVIVIEHNLDIIKNSQHIIDLGPEGGDGGGKIVATGSPKEISNNTQSHTGEFLKKIL